MNILGISAFYHDSAACLVSDGRLLAAAQEERFTRKKHDASFPAHAIKYCLNYANLAADQLDNVVFYEKPFLKFERLLKSYLAYAPSGIKSFLKSMPMWLNEKLWMKDYLADQLKYKGEILFVQHHESHAASAFFPSPYSRAAIITVDGVGEWTTASIGVGNANQIKILKEIRFPDSLGLLYSAFTYYTGFKVNSGEYKVMGLAPYGDPRFKDLILNELIELKEDGSFRLNQKYFNYCVGLTMTNRHFDKLFGGPPRKPESPITQKEMDLARSVQEATEEVMIRMVKYAKKITGEQKLCLAGGVALNCVANGKILRERIFDDVWVQPAAGDAGGALGAALFVWYQYLQNKRTANEINDTLFGSFLGPESTDNDIEAFLNTHQVPYQKLGRKEMLEKISDLIAQENVIGWFQNRMEFGPRALGARSILGDARSEKMQETINLKIKFRESFRPFAPSVLREKVTDYFDLERESPYMLLVASVKNAVRRNLLPGQEKLSGLEKLKTVRSTIPAVTHVDYSARIQTVEEKNNPLYYQLIKTFDEKYHCPVIINTSFNVRGEPLVCTPEEAYACFMHTNMDYLAMGSFLISKTEQNSMTEPHDWLSKFERD